MNGNFDFGGTVMSFKDSEKHQHGLEKNVYFNLVNYKIDQDVATSSLKDNAIFKGKLIVEFNFANLKASTEPQLAVLEAIGKLIATGKSELKFTKNGQPNATQNQ